MACFREKIRKTFKDIVPFDSMEEKHKEWSLDWLDSGKPLCCVQPPAIPPVHLVSYGVLIDPLNSTILLGEHKHTHLWLASGGHVLPQQSPFEAAFQDIDEETSSCLSMGDLNPLFLSIDSQGRSLPDHVHVTLWYVMHTSSSCPVALNPDFFSNQSWFDFDKIPSPRTDPHLSRFLKKYCIHSFCPKAA